MTDNTMARLLGAPGAWGREARRAWALATRLGITLDEEALLLRDVRDLQALCHRLHALESRGSGAHGRRAADPAPDARPAGVQRL